MLRAAGGFCFRDTAAERSGCPGGEAGLDFDPTQSPPRSRQSYRISQVFRDAQDVSSFLERFVPAMEAGELVD